MIPNSKVIMMDLFILYVLYVQVIGLLAAPIIPMISKMEPADDRGIKEGIALRSAGNEFIVLEFVLIQFILPY